MTRRKNEDRFSLEAKEKGLTITGSGKNCDFRLYRFDDCGHEYEIQVASVRRCRGKFKCSKCVDEKIRLVASHNDLEVVSRLNGNYVRYKFKGCGHIQDMQYHHVEAGQFQCKQCIRDRESSSAESVGLSIIGRGKNSNYRLVRIKDCGHIQEIRMSDIERNRFQCRTCGDHFWVRPSNIYLAKVRSACGFEWLKLGYARVISNRSNLYGLPDGSSFNLVTAVAMSTARDASAAEKAIHKKYKPIRLNPDEMKEFHRMSGFTECYPVSAIDTLYKEILNLKAKGNNK